MEIDDQTHTTQYYTQKHGVKRGFCFSFLQIMQEGRKVFFYIPLSHMNERTGGDRMNGTEWNDRMDGMDTYLRPSSTFSLALFSRIDVAAVLASSPSGSCFVA